MKIFRLVNLFALFVMLLSACAGPAPVAPTAANAAPTSKELNLYAWTDYVPQQMLDEFTAKYGIKVNYDTYSSNEEMLAKLQAGASGYDVSVPSDYTHILIVTSSGKKIKQRTRLENLNRSKFCPSERSEESLLGRQEILCSAQGDESGSTESH